MREILFRGKRTDNGEWVQGSLFAEGSRVEIVRGTCNNVGIEGVDVIPETVGQFTGLTDKNGKKIFEGDILIINNQHKYPVLVKFIDFSWTCVIPNNNAYLNYRHRLENNLTKYEIIGNIHDNPELLGDK